MVKTPKLCMAFAKRHTGNKCGYSQLLVYLLLFACIQTHSRNRISDTNHIWFIYGISESKR